VYLGAGRNVFHRHRVTRANLGPVIADNPITDTQTERSNNVSLLAIHVIQQSNARGAVGIVLNGRYASGNTFLVPLEINLTVATLVTAAPVADRNLATEVAATTLAQPTYQRFLWLGARYFFKCWAAHTAAARRSGFVNFYSHYLPPE